jgi:hypothetical protein
LISNLPATWLVLGSHTEVGAARAFTPQFGRPRLATTPLSDHRRRLLTHQTTIKAADDATRESRSDTTTPVAWQYGTRLDQQTNGTRARGGVDASHAHMVGEQFTELLGRPGSMDRGHGWVRPPSSVRRSPTVATDRGSFRLPTVNGAGPLPVGRTTQPHGARQYMHSALIG